MSQNLTSLTNCTSLTIKSNKTYKTFEFHKILKIHKLHKSHKQDLCTAHISQKILQVSQTRLIQFTNLTSLTTSFNISQTMLKSCTNLRTSLTSNSYTFHKSHKQFLYISQTSQSRLIHLTNLTIKPNKYTV